jgi:multiple sugar transport system substrate-binding protein
VIGLARWLQSSGTTVALPMIHTDLVPTFFTLAANLGEVPLAHADRRVLSPTHLDRVLDLLLELRDAAHPDSPFMDPPRLFDRMSTTDDIAYCPLAFGYTNYAREGFRRKRLRFVDMPSASPAPVGSTLGGAGIAISARCRYPAAAAQYARWLCAPDVQLGSYFDGGGQPANRSAWIKEHTNEATHGFFRDTIATLDAANVRPRWPGYLVFQDLAGPALHEYVLGDIDRPTLGRRLEDARLASLLARADQEARM